MLRSPANWQPSMHSTQRPSCSDSTSSKPAAADVNDSRFNTSSCCAKETCQYDGINPLAPDVRLDSSAVEQGYADVSSHTVRSEETDSNSNTDLDDALHDAQQLVQAAEHIVKESCGEDWLLQPFIPDMERNEYPWADALLVITALPQKLTACPSLLVTQAKPEKSANLCFFSAISCTGTNSTM